MDCDAAREQLGPYLDDELWSEARCSMEAHLTTCPTCADELESLRALAQELAQGNPVVVPEALWASIEERLDRAAEANSNPPPFRNKRWILRWPFAAAASVLLVVGLGLLGLVWFQGGASTAEASTIDFSMLLDALPLDAPKAFRKFLIHHHASETSVQGARRHAPRLNFAIPASLPGGFRLRSVYTLRVGQNPGVAAKYFSRDGEFLAAVFHPPIHREDFGAYKSYPCVIGEQCGHTIRVGPWQLVHLTDPTTCHCILSRLVVETELPAIMAAMAPGSPAWNVGPHNH